ncbi:hypothetical protein [Spirosoma litoris]
MKTTRQFINVLLTSLLMIAPIINAKALAIVPGDSTTKKSSFEVGLYMGAEKTLNIILDIHTQRYITYGAQSIHE